MEVKAQQLETSGICNQVFYEDFSGDFFRKQESSQGAKKAFMIIANGRENYAVKCRLKSLSQTVYNF